MNQRNVLSLLPLALLGGMAVAQAPASDDHGAVFVMTNAAVDNQIVSYERSGDGSLQQSGMFLTGGNGSGGTVDPLKSQGSLVLAGDHRRLFAVNAGSGTVSTFAVHGANLDLLDDSPSGGSMPTAVAHFADMLYVLNAGGDGNINGFRVGWDGHLNPIQNSMRALSSSSASPTSIKFSPDGRFLVVTEMATNNIDVYLVRGNGSLSDAVVNRSDDASPFATVFTERGALVVASAANFVSSYTIQDDGKLKTITASLPSGGMATCWNVITPSSRFTYTSNAGSGTISAFSVALKGALKALPGTIVGTNPAGSANVDAALADGGKYLYTLDAGTGAVSQFTVNGDGTLDGPQVFTGLTGASGLQGIAAY